MSEFAIASNVINCLLKAKNRAKELQMDRIDGILLLDTLLRQVDCPLFDAIQFQADNEIYMDILADCQEFLMDFSADSEIPDNMVDDTCTEKAQRSQKNKKKNKRQYPTLLFKLEESKNISIVFEEELKDFVASLGEKLENKETITIEMFTYLFIMEIPQSIIPILRLNGIDIRLLQTHCADTISTMKETQEAQKIINSLSDSPANEKVQNVKNAFEIPDKIKSFTTDWTEKYAGQVCDICGRDKECELVWLTLQKKTKRNVILIGNPGTGKTSIGKKITYDIISGNCPEEFKNFRVICVDVNSIVAGTSYRGQAEERFKDLVEFLNNNPKLILFIDEIHLINGAGACSDNNLDMANALKPILAESTARVIGATTIDEYKKSFSKDGAVKRRFRVVEVKEPKCQDVYPMLKKSIEELSKYHGVSISRKMIDYIIFMSSCFNNETCNPDRTKDLIDLSMVIAKKHGSKCVSKKHVLENFKESYEKFSKMDTDMLKSTAYHEAGHCLVHLFSPLLKKNAHVLAVSIMPAEDYLGVTVYEDSEVYDEPGNMDYYTDCMARMLGGRVAEKMYTNQYSSGASSDLERATSEAYNLVTKFGMTSFGENRIYFSEVNSQEVMNAVNKEIDAIIAKSMKRAQEILEQHKDALEKLVEMLMKNGIVSEAEIAEILQEELALA